MSVFGGDSWAREAQQRKRRVDDLIVEGVDASSYRKLSSGKFACFVCLHNPILDNPLMLSMHRKGSRHRAADSRLKEKELSRQYEINKRIAFSESPTRFDNSSTYAQKVRLASKPLIQQTRKATSEIISNTNPPQKSRNGSCNVNFNWEGATNAESALGESSSVPLLESNNVMVAQHQLDLRERRERELKFIEAGWKRDGHGKWFKDENVEFDSDEEDPNDCLL
ncbi:sodium channel modifier 1 [Tripterygium wilfordii]|uniref:Sodium channel modifier 1 n=1 Tax=Tripterygium wilfordii TaxID=458696 RepID=A0A7J7DY31_TRIWF|nr:sodium channel modifier 1-like [Tripterygium wilfordii]KAF5751223.1 sodium channel modifier 1 [Tripterygium wilfordii]